MSKIIFTGDSVTQGAWTVDSQGNQLTGLTTSQKFSTLIGNGLGYTEIINSGKSGDDISELYARLQTDIISQNPDAVFIMIGINDVRNANPTPLTTFKASYLNIITALQNANIAKIVILTPSFVRESQSGSDFPAYLDVMNEVAREKGVLLIPVYDYFTRLFFKVDTSTWDSYHHDSAHISAIGHQLVADYVLSEQFDTMLPVGGVIDQGDPVDVSEFIDTVTEALPWINGAYLSGLFE